jgi:hypothetical protein
MNKEFIPYEQAVALKKLGFDDKTFKSYDTSVVLVNGKYILDNWYDVSTVDEVKAPLYQQAFRWFREKYDLDSWITREHKYQEPFCWYIQDNITEYSSDFSTNGLTFETFFQTHEEAELECLKKLISIVKERQ